MKHYSMQDCVDFARGVLEESVIAQMQQHLDEGCDKCSKNIEVWRHVMKFAKKEGQCAPPESSIRLVEASFAIRQLMSARTKKFELATLVFDSSEVTPITAGVRSSAASARQLLYKSGSFCIDMRMQPKPGSDSVVLMGQLLDSSRPAHGIGDVPVSLLCEGDTLSHKTTNQVGEFEFGFGILRDVQLVFGMGESMMLVVPVPNPSN